MSADIGVEIRPSLDTFPQAPSEIPGTLSVVAEGPVARNPEEETLINNLYKDLAGLDAQKENRWDSFYKESPDLTRRLAQRDRGAVDALMRALQRQEEEGIPHPSEVGAASDTESSQEANGQISAEQVEPPVTIQEGSVSAITRDEFMKKVADGYFRKHLQGETTAVQDEIANKVDKVASKRWSRRKVFTALGAGVAAIAGAKIAREVAEVPISNSATPTGEELPELSRVHPAEPNTQTPFPDTPVLEPAPSSPGRPQEVPLQPVSEPRPVTPPTLDGPIARSDDTRSEPLPKEEATPEPRLKSEMQPPYDSNPSPRIETSQPEKIEAKRIPITKVDVDEEEVATTEGIDAVEILRGAKEIEIGEHTNSETGGKTTTIGEETFLENGEGKEWWLSNIWYSVDNAAAFAMLNNRRLEETYMKLDPVLEQEAWATFQGNYPQRKQLLAWYDQAVEEREKLRAVGITPENTDSYRRSLDQLDSVKHIRDAMHWVHEGDKFILPAFEKTQDIITFYRQRTS